MLKFRDVEAPVQEKATDNIEMRVKPSVKERILNEHQITTLSERDRKMLLKALDEPPPPTAVARDAVHDYRSRIVNAG